MVDAKTGIDQTDFKIKNWLLENYNDKKIILLANKVDDENLETEYYNDIYSLNFENPKFISAENGLNIHDIWESLDELITDENTSEYRKLKKKRLHRIKEYKNKWKLELQKIYPTDNSKIIELIEDFDYLNKDLKYNSDLDNP